MPSVDFIVQWPDGNQEKCYSPSTVIYEYLETNKPYTLDEFMHLSEHALKTASERVREKFGYACSAANDQLMTIRRRVDDLKNESPTGPVIVIYMNS